jgi:PadR family transcriptional regulator, regulatory protein PadR
MARGEYLGELEQVVLLAVARLEGEAYGMNIRRQIEERAGRSVAIGAVYSTLERLHEKGHIRQHERVPESGRDGRPRRFFELTRAGVDALRAANELQARMWAGLRLTRAGRS